MALKTRPPRGLRLHFLDNYECNPQRTQAILSRGGFAMTALTALTAQNTHGVSAVHPVPPDFLRRQIDAVLGGESASGGLGVGRRGLCKPNFRAREGP